MNVDTHHVLAYAEATTPTDELHSQVEDVHSDIKLLNPSVFESIYYFSQTL